MYHFKDSPPMRTVNHIRGILEPLGIMPIENRWINVKNQSYSVRLSVDGTSLGTNGKGISAEWALASACGEFMERIQNQALFSLFTYYQCDEQLQALHGFRSFPDEVYLSVSELMKKTGKSILQHIIPADLSENESPDEYIRALSTLTLHPESKKLLCLPYYCINTDSLVYLPRTALSYVYGTNGMCAGNTPEEALVQGICEIIERYTNKMVLLNKLTPPDIPQEYFSQPSQKRFIRLLEKNKILKVIVKDASLGEELPSVCITIVNKHHNKYFVKFASHVEFEMALERTLTELLQGKTIERLEKGDFMAFFEYFLDEPYTDEDNFFTIFGTGEGVYNNNFFGDSPSYPLYEDYCTQTNLKNNKEYLRHLVQKLKKIGWTILVRDVSFLGFPAFHIVIPGISELSTINKETCIGIKRKIEVASFLRDINTCTEQELRKIAEVVEKEREKNEHGNIADLTGILYLDGFPWKNINFNLFLSALYLRLGDFAASHACMKKYITEIKEKNIKLEAGGLQYYKCVRDYLAVLTEETGDTEEKIGILKQIYGDNIVSEVIKSIRPEKALKYYIKLPCPDCSNCPFRMVCSYERLQNIHMKLKEKLAHNSFDQLSTNRDFWNEFIISD
jgi:ribosomal protein S12 methylthiotransferase accessory factor